MGKPKVALQIIAADDCEIMVGRVFDEEAGTIVEPGEALRPHVGETVAILPITSMGEVLALGRFGALAAGEKTPAAMLEMDASMDALCKGLAGRVVSWTWTDMMGDALPQPYKRPDVIKSLTAEEIMWLRGAVQGETPGARKNGSRLSPSTSSAGASKRQR